MRERIYYFFVVIIYSLTSYLEKERQMQTRSEIRKQLQENEMAIREICAGFDEAHLAWTANKKREKYGMYSYLPDREKKKKSKNISYPREIEQNGIILST